MKRKSKILALIFSVIVAFSVLAIMAPSFASEPIKGVQTIVDEKYNILPSTWGGTASAKQNYSSGKVTFLISGRSGSVKSASSMPYEENKYAIYTQEDKVNSNSPYMYSVVGTYPDAELLNNSSDDISKFSYFTLDVDVMSPTGKFVDGSQLYFSTRRLSSSGTKDFWNNAGLNNMVVFGNDSNGAYIYAFGNNSNKKYVDPYEFTHITAIFEPKVSGSSYSAILHVYINGEYFASKTTTTSTSFYKNVPHVSMYEYRFNFTTANDPTQSVAVDNTTFRSFSKEYNGNLSSVIASKGSLNSWESTLYNEDEMPAGYMEAINETQGKYYRSVSDALTDAKGGDTITIVSDQSEPITVNKLVSIKLIKSDGTTAAATLTPAEGYAIYERLSGVWQVEPVDLPVYEYTAGGVVQTAGRSTEFSKIMADADAGTTVYILEDAYINSTSRINLSKNLTIDFQGHTAYVSTTDHKCFMAPSKSLTLKNGTLVAEFGKDMGANGKSYTFFDLSSSSNLTLDNMKTYTGQIAWSYNSSTPKITINGGEHYMLIPATGVISGFIESRANMTFTANDATFYCGSNGGGLLTSCHYNSSASTKNSTFTYNNCTIIGASAQTNLIKYSNSHTNIYFNDCDIFGSITPVAHSWDIDRGYVGPEFGDIVINNNSRFSENATFSSFVDIGVKCSISNINEYEKYNLTLTSGTLAKSNFAFVDYEVNALYDAKIVSVDSFTVTWYKEDGKSIIKTDKVPYGETATPPDYGYDSPNKWFTAKYSGWAKSPTGNKITDFTITRDTKFYPAPILASVRPNIQGALYNLSLVGAIGINFYLPAPCDGVTLNGVYLQDGSELFPETVYNSGEKYYLYNIGTIAATSLSDSITVTVDYTTVGKTQKKDFSLSPLVYANSILSDSDNGSPTYRDSAYPLVYNMIRYSNSLIKYVSYEKSGIASGNAELEALLDQYSKFATELPSDFSDVSDVNITDLIGYVSYVTFEVSEYQPSYKIGFKKDAEIVDCYITLDGYYSSAFAGANSGKITYESTDKEFYEGSSHLCCAYIRNVPMYNADSTVTITVLLENGIKRSGTYNLNAYYNGVKTENQTQKSHLELFLKSFRAFSDSAEKYRFNSITITEKDAKNFTNCDHASAEKIIISITDRVIPITTPAYYCRDCKAHLIYYSDYNVVGDGVSYGLGGAEGTNDFAAIRTAHTKANAIAEAFPYYNVVVVGRGTVGNNFYIGTPDDNGANAIKVKTNVDWNGAHFIIDDTTVTNKNKSSGYAQSIFLVSSDAQIPTFSITSKMPAGVAQGATNIGFAPGEPLMITLTLQSVRHYIRYGGNANTGGAQSEIIIVDAYGNVDPTTPIQWDYTNEPFCSIIKTQVNKNSYSVEKCPTVDVNGDGKCDSCGSTVTTAFSASARRISDKPLLINGLDKNGNINCTWETITNSDVDVSSYDQFKRNILITRANVTIQGMDRIFVEDDSKYTPRQTYAGFVQVSNAYNTTIKDMLITHHLGHNIWKDGVDTGVSLGSYEFSGGQSVNTSWINCKAKNFFTDGGKVSYRGMFGTNGMRNSYLKNCVLPSFDSHTAAYNVTIEDSTFEHINYVGGGTVIMKNVSVYVNGGYAACILRSDYGSLWNGDIKMDGITLLHPDTYSREYVDLVRAHYTNHYFGYDAYLPGKIYVNNISIKEYVRDTAEYTSENGIIIENNTKKSSKKLGIYSILNGEMKGDYDHSTRNEKNLGPKICTEAIYITNSDVEILYPNHWFFDDMKVYIDGELQDWFVVREGLHTDSNGDGICDNGCGQ